ncbi:transposase zinc-binding domain-containing protein [Ottowia sp.]|uniref:transposase zinc-binding domain-containing protein n=1 Tax=Ottowia sp. TaxID=1898956 RepID=UPI0034540BCF
MPRFIKDEFDAFLECGILAHGFLRLRCGECGHDKLLAFSCKRRGFCPLAAPGACRRPLRTWSTTSSRTCRCGNGCCRCRSAARAAGRAAGTGHAGAAGGAARGHATSAAAGGAQG